MRETKTADHKFDVTISHELFKRMKAEYSFKVPGGSSKASYGVIGKLIEIVEKRYKSVSLNYKGQ
jgi:hypothetical protein